MMFFVLNVLQRRVLIIYLRRELNINVPFVLLYTKKSNFRILKTTNPNSFNCFQNSLQ